MPEGQVKRTRFVPNVCRSDRRTRRPRRHRQLHRPQDRPTVGRWKDRVSGFGSRVCRAFRFRILDFRFRLLSPDSCLPPVCSIHPSSFRLHPSLLLSPAFCLEPQTASLAGRVKVHPAGRGRLHRAAGGRWPWVVVAGRTARCGDRRHIPKCPQMSRKRGGGPGPLDSVIRCVSVGWSHFLMASGGHVHGTPLNRTGPGSAHIERSRTAH
jgi:hypothetical protein